jgi:hypothetical protein
VLNIYHSKLKEHIGTKLADKNKSETYLTNLFQVPALLSVAVLHYNIDCQNVDFQIVDLKNLNRR